MIAVVAPSPIPTHWNSLDKIKTAKDGEKKTAMEPMLAERLLTIRSLLSPRGSVNGILTKLPTDMAIGVIAANQELSSTLRWRRGEVEFT